MRMLFIDFSSTFNTIIPSRLIHKLSTLGISSPLCSWIMDFLTCRPQCVRMGEHTSPSLTLSTGRPQGIVLSPLLYTLYTHDCTTTHNLTFLRIVDTPQVFQLLKPKTLAEDKDDSELTRSVKAKILDYMERKYFCNTVSTGHLFFPGSQIQGRLHQCWKPHRNQGKIDG
ncbi:hypothetical protein NFI96_002418 [Prochilodus magdalenae]|nr:hypothetical protein NFI96_002418 [Prochilodus magdalenae]